MNYDLIQDVFEFANKFGFAYEGPARELPPAQRTLRYNRLVSEMDEFVQAFEKGDHTGQLDALVDLVYVAIGTAIAHGWDFDRAWSRVHKANMTKIRDGIDVIKPPGFVHPDLSDLVMSVKRKK